MQPATNRHRSTTNQRRRAVDPMTSSTDTTASSSRGGGCGGGARGGRGSSIHPLPSQQQQYPLRTDNLKDFKERVDSTIQQLSGLVSLLSSKDAPVAAHPCNSSNRGDALLQNMSQLGASGLCCCKCHEGGFSQASAVVPPLPTVTASVGPSSTAARRQARSSREFSAAISATPAASANSMFRRTMTTGDIPEAPAVSEAAIASPVVSRRKTAPPPLAQAKPTQQLQQMQQLLEPVTTKACTASGSVLRFLWYDSSNKRYAVRDAEVICAKNVKRLHISVHYFRVAGEDMLLLEKDCSDDGLAFLDTDSVVAFEGLSVEKLLVLQELGCQLRPEELSREFAVEKGRCKYYVVPVEDDNGKWRLCPRAGHHQLESLRRMLEQQVVRQTKKAA